MIYDDGNVITSLTFYKSMLFKHTPDECIKRLNMLRRADFNVLKIPAFDFTVHGNEVIIESDYIKGKYACEEDMIKVKADCMSGDWGFGDFHYTNFKVHRFTREVYAIDLEQFQQISVNDRKINWSKNWKSL